MKINRLEKFLLALVLTPAWFPLLTIKKIVELIEDTLGILFGDKWFWFEE